MNFSRFKPFLPIFLSLTFCGFFLNYSVFADEVESEKNEYFNSTEEFKVFTSNGIFLYEPCNALNEDESDPDLRPLQGNYTLHTGSSSSVEDIIYNSAFGIARNSWVAAAGILDAVKYLDNDNLESFNPLENNGYLKWSSSEFSELKNFVKTDTRLGNSGANISEDLVKILDGDTSVSDWKAKLIAAEFTFYFKKYSSKITDGLFIEGGEYDSGGEETEREAVYAGNAFLDPTSSSPAKKITHSPTFTRLSPTGRGESDNGITVRLTNFSNSGDHKTRAYLIGDSLAHRSMNLSETPIENINAAEGRTFEQGISLISGGESDSKYLIYALGNNNCIGTRCNKSNTIINDSMLSEVVIKARETYGDKVFILFLTSYRPVNGNGTDYSLFEELPSNVTIRALAESDDHVRVLDWAAKLKSTGSSISDYVDATGHPSTVKGAQLFWELVESALIEAESDYNWDNDHAPCLDHSNHREDVEVGVGDDWFGDDDGGSGSGGSSSSSGGGSSGGSSGESGGSGSSGGSGGTGGSGTSGDGSASISDWFKTVKSRASKYWMGQCGESFSSLQFSQNNICTDGCSVVAFSMVASIYYNAKITPKDTVSLTGAYRSRSSTDSGVISTMASNASKKGYNLRTSDISYSKMTIENVDKILKQKKMIIISCEGGVPCARTGKTTKGHYIAIVGIDPSNSNNYIIANSHGKDPYKSRQSFSKNSVLELIRIHKRSGKIIWREN